MVNRPSDTITRKKIDDAGFFCEQCGSPIYEWPIPVNCYNCEAPFNGINIGQQPLRVMTAQEELERLELNQQNISERLKK